MTRFKVEGMCCAEETAILRKVVGDLVESPDILRFDIINGVMSLEKNLSDKEIGEVTTVVASTGMSARLLGATGKREEAPKSLWSRHGRSILCRMNLYAHSA